MPDRVSSSSKALPDLDTVALWEEQYGKPLLNALAWIVHWREEARDEPREVTFQEFHFRAIGALSYDGTKYHMEEGVAETIAQMGTPGLLRAASDTAVDAELGPVPRLDYEFARHVARVNLIEDGELPSCLRAFASPAAVNLKRPKGPDPESRLLLKVLAWWGVDRAVRLGLLATTNRIPAANRAEGNLPCATNLVAALFLKAGLGQITANSVVDAWEAHRHEGSSKRKLTIKSHAQAFARRFHELDELIIKLPPSS